MALPMRWAPRAFLTELRSVDKFKWNKEDVVDGVARLVKMF